jgi:hypothetical protein
MNFKKLLACSFWFVLFGGVSANESKEDLCGSDEIMVASCSLNEKKNRILSFCASADKKTIFYRFGTKSTIELMKSFSIEKPVFRWVDAATYTTYFGFRSSGYSYVFGVPQEVLGARAFLEVTSLNKSVMSRTCTDNSFGRKSIMSEAVRDVEDSMVRGGGFLFPPNSIKSDESPNLKRE